MKSISTIFFLFMSALVLTQTGKGEQNDYSRYIYCGNAEFEYQGDGIYSHLDDMARGEYGWSYLNRYKNTYTTDYYARKPHKLTNSQKKEIEVDINNDITIQKFFKKYGVKETTFTLIDLESDVIISSFTFNIK